MWPTQSPTFPSASHVHATRIPLPFNGNQRPTGYLCVSVLNAGLNVLLMKHSEPMQGDKTIQKKIKPDRHTTRDERQLLKCHGIKDTAATAATQPHGHMATRPPLHNTMCTEALAVTYPSCMPNTIKRRRKGKSTLVDGSR